MSLPCLVLLGVAASCGNDYQSTDDCSTSVDLACKPGYEPTFDNLFQNTLQPSCALSGGSCHAAAGHQAGLVLDDVEIAHQTLLERGRAVPGKPECSVM